MMSVSRALAGGANRQVEAGLEGDLVGSRGGCDISYLLPGAIMLT